VEDQLQSASSLQLGPSQVDACGIGTMKLRRATPTRFFDSALILALAGPTELLGKVRLHYAERDGQSLFELCTWLGMKRQIIRGAIGACINVVGGTLFAASQSASRAKI